MDFKGFVDFLRKFDPDPDPIKKPVNVLVNLIPVYKRIEDSFFVVDFGNELPESAPFATTRPQYERARNNGHFNILSDSFALHESWSRDVDELKFKISN